MVHGDDEGKFSAQLMTAHAGMDMISLYCETFQNAHDWDCSLLRNGFQSDPISPAQPQPIYYVLRSISTVLDGFKAAPFELRFTGDRKYNCYTFRRGDHELMATAWIPGKTKDGLAEAKSDLTFSGVSAQRGWVLDVLNGTEQELNLTATGNDTMLKDILIKDYPTFVRVVKR
jgi:hypothetical protein